MLTIKEGSKLEEALTTACESLQSAVKAAGVEVSDENISKEYEGISPCMISLVEQYKFKFENLSWEYQKIPDPEDPEDLGTKILFELLSLLDYRWARQLRERQECNDASLKTILQTMNLLIPSRGSFSIFFRPQGQSNKVPSITSHVQFSEYYKLMLISPRIFHSHTYNRKGCVQNRVTQTIKTKKKKQQRYKKPIWIWDWWTFNRRALISTESIALNKEWSLSS